MSIKFVVCKMKTDEKNHKKELFAKAVTKKRKNNKKTLVQSESTASHQQPKIMNIINHKNNRVVITGFSKFGKTYVMKLIPLQKQEIF